MTQLQDMLKELQYISSNSGQTAGLTAGMSAGTTAEAAAAAGMLHSTSAAAAADCGLAQSKYHQAVQKLREQHELLLDKSPAAGEEDHLNRLLQQLELGNVTEVQQLLRQRHRMLGFLPGATNR